MRLRPRVIGTGGAPGRLALRRSTPLGPPHGVEGSQAPHQEVKRFYGPVKELNPQLKQEAQCQVAQQRIHSAGQQHSRSCGLGM